MTKTDLVNAVAKSVEGITKKKAAEVVDAVFAGIHGSLKKEDKVQIVGFGTFEVQKRAARQGVILGSQKVIQILQRKSRAGKAPKGGQQQEVVFIL